MAAAWVFPSILVAFFFFCLSMVSLGHVIVALFSFPLMPAVRGRATVPLSHPIQPRWMDGWRQPADGLRLRHALSSTRPQPMPEPSMKPWNGLGTASLSIWFGGRSRRGQVSADTQPLGTRPHWALAHGIVLIVKPY